MESALAFPLLVVLALALVQFALYAHAVDVAEGACQDGARVAAQADRSVGDGVATARSLLQAGLGPSAGQVAVTGQTDGQVVVVRAQGPVPLLCPGSGTRRSPSRRQPRRTRRSSVPTAARGERGQALVELALAAPLLLLLTSGVLAAGRIARAELGVAQVAGEAARAAALADSREAAQQEGMAHGQTVAREDGLTDGSLGLVVEASDFGRGGSVGANATYTVAFDDLPLLGWAHLTLSSRHTEPVDRYRSLTTGGGQ